MRFFTAVTWPSLHARSVAHEGRRGFSCVGNVGRVSKHVGQMRRDLNPCCYVLLPLGQAVQLHCSAEEDVVAAVKSITLAIGAQGMSQYRSIVEVCVVFLDTLTPVFEFYVRLRERRQRTTARVEWQLDLSSMAARLRGEGEQEDLRPSSSSGQRRSGVGPSPPAD
ncbi:hypothetical protein Taro_039422 [Colocasia esculenta]|uniref:Uncharacterized protein n=1 Tax=Colocasia esculenta TaxID=4460 RepID=A0A843WRH9_COLES|nr:hypothetical protein [Colocasia esculenta]